jgi:hypothetical protein
MASNHIQQGAGNLFALCQFVRICCVPIDDLSSAHSESFLIYTRLLFSGAGKKVQS